MRVSIMKLCHLHYFSQQTFIITGNLDAYVCHFFASPLFVFLSLNLSLNLLTDFVEQQSNEASYFALNMNIFHAAITNMYHLFILPAFMRALFHTRCNAYCVNMFERVSECVRMCYFLGFI